jgi:replicative DNA helicase
MTATAGQRPAAPRFTERRHAESLARQWDPEHQLIGALMHLEATRVAPILDLVPDHAIHDPIARWAYEIIGALVDAGHDPDPVAVLATGRRQPGRQALNPEATPSPRQHHRLALHLADAYTSTVSPTLAHSYAREVLDQAYRRSFRAHGMAMVCLADAGADRETLADHFRAAECELADLSRRAHTVLDTDSGRCRRTTALKQRPSAARSPL